MRSDYKVMDECVLTFCSKPKIGENLLSRQLVSKYLSLWAHVFYTYFFYFIIGETSEVTQCHDIEPVSESGADARLWAEVETAGDIAVNGVGVP